VLSLSEVNDSLFQEMTVFSNNLLAHLFLKQGMRGMGENTQLQLTKKLEATGIVAFWNITSILQSVI